MTLQPRVAARTTVPGRLRPGQAEALKRWAEALRNGSSSELVVVPVGYGKTIIGVGSFEVAAGLVSADTCLYLTPTDVLRTQVYNGLEKALTTLGSSRPIRKILAENAAMGRIRATAANFIVATYQQVAAAPAGYEALCRERRVHVVCDEAHHLSESGRWAAALGALRPVSTLQLSATPVRLDRAEIAGARYVQDEGGLTIDPLVQVSMRQAWQERRILKHLNMQMKDYAVEVRSADGETRTFTASEMAELPDFDQRFVRQQLRWNEDYVAPLVNDFATTLRAKMELAPRQHQGLVFAATTEHANHLQRVFARWHPSLRCVVVHSVEIGDVENERRLRDFHEGRYDVLIQVKKANEGFDAPAVSVLLKLDAVFSREPVIQQFGRGLRFNHNLPEAQNLLNVFIGRDPRLAPIIEHLEREVPPAPLTRPAAGASARTGVIGERGIGDQQNSAPCGGESSHWTAGADGRERTSRRLIVAPGRRCLPRHAPRRGHRKHEHHAGPVSPARGGGLSVRFTAGAALGAFVPADADDRRVSARSASAGTQPTPASGHRPCEEQAARPEAAAASRRSRPT
ncbi:MAG: DEAD/DEAH box helicase family protein [Dehalococcoidia bacterium]|nr:DEAD/DEAH box helicase family protein [Dehalococcoidia bacterium]